MCVELFAIHLLESPRHFAVRKLLAAEDGVRALEQLVFASLEAAQSWLAQRGLTRVPRGGQDEPTLVETWL